MLVFTGLGLWSKARAGRGANRVRVANTGNIAGAAPSPATVSADKAANTAVAIHAANAARAARTPHHAPQTSAGRPLRIVLAVLVAVLACAFAAHQLPTKVSLWNVLWMVPLAGLAIGALNGVIITRGGMQPFIVTLAAMVGVLGAARLIAGQDTAVYSIYSGSNATSDIEALREEMARLRPARVRRQKDSSSTRGRSNPASIPRRPSTSCAWKKTPRRAT